MAIQFRILCTWNLVKRMKNWKKNKADSDPWPFSFYSMYLKPGKTHEKLKTKQILIPGRSISYSMYLKAGKILTVTNFSRIYFREMHQLACVKL